VRPGHCRPLIGFGFMVLPVERIFLTGSSFSTVRSAYSVGGWLDLWLLYDGESLILPSALAGRCTHYLDVRWHDDPE
jgi:hypothetical protein